MSCLAKYPLEPSDVGGDPEKYVYFPALLLKVLHWGMELAGHSPASAFPPPAPGSKSQNCLWNSLIDGLTGNVKEKPRPTIVHDPRPPEEILADELPQLDSPEAFVKTSFRLGDCRSGRPPLFAGGVAPVQLDTWAMRPAHSLSCVHRVKSALMREWWLEGR